MRFFYVAFKGKDIIAFSDIERCRHYHALGFRIRGRVIYERP